MRHFKGKFRGQMEGEIIVGFSRKHWVTLLPDAVPFVLFMMIAISAIIFVGSLSNVNTSDDLFQVMTALGLIALGYLIHRFFLHMIRFFLSVTIFTNCRIVEIRKTIFVHDVKESINFSEIQDLEYEQEGFFKNILKLGDIRITLGGGNEVVRLTQLPNPDFHFRLINQLKIEYLNKNPISYKQ